MHIIYLKGREHVTTKANTHTEHACIRTYGHPLILAEHEMSAPYVQNTTSELCIYLEEANTQRTRFL